MKGKRQEAPPVEELLVSLTGTPFPKWMKWFALVVGILLVGDGMRSFAFHKVLVGAVLAYVSGFDKRIVLSPEGIVRQTRTWITRHSTTIPWGEVQYVNFAYRGSKMMCFFERGVTGIRVLFDRSDEPEVKRILGRYIPDVETGTLGKEATDGG
ncbi:MAG: hypothetical protein WBJ42_03245 [Thermovirgaceae bacterium]|nr:hypothetical protein [Synergistales bacterium]HRS48483.1 hypothetical protein [Thermovirgaceae bacterium]